MVTCEGEGLVEYEGCGGVGMKVRVRMVERGGVRGDWVGELLRYLFCSLKQASHVDH